MHKLYLCNNHALYVYYKMLAVLGAQCSQIVYNTGDNRPATDTQPDVYLTMGAGLVGTLATLAAIALLVVTVFTASTLRYRASKIVKASQPVMLSFILGGGVYLKIIVL